MTSDSPWDSVDSGPLRFFGGLGPWFAVAFLWLWAGSGSPWALLLSGFGVVAAIAVEAGGRNRWRGAGTVLVLVGILVGFFAERQIGSVLGDWDGYWDQRIDQIGDLLSTELEERRQLAGEAASDALVERWIQDPGSVDGAVVAEIRDRFGSSALALYDPSGGLVAWDGTHRGKLPENVQAGERRQAYRDLPLFGYFYLTSRGEDGSVAVAAYLLRASLPEGLDADMGDLASRFFAETGERIRITEQDPGFADAVWDLALYDDRLYSVVLEEPALEERLATLRTWWAWVVSGLAAVAWILLALGGPLPRREAAASALAVVAAAAWLPLSALGRVAPLLDGATFALSGPLSLSLARLAAVTVAMLPLDVGCRRSPDVPISARLDPRRCRGGAPGWWSHRVDRL
jgi:hypothetical protein